MIDDSLVNNHIDVSDMLDFLSIKTMNHESVRKIGEINYHLINCEECRTLMDDLKKKLSCNIPYE